MLLWKLLAFNEPHSTNAGFQVCGSISAMRYCHQLKSYIQIDGSLAGNLILCTFLQVKLGTKKALYTEKLARQLVAYEKHVWLANSWRTDALSHAYYRDIHTCVCQHRCAEMYCKNVSNGCRYIYAQILTVASLFQLSQGTFSQINRRLFFVKYNWK